MARAIVRQVLGAVIVGSIVVACAGEPDAAAPAASPPASATGVAAFPAVVDAPNGRLTIERRPERIVSLSPTATEMLFAIGAGDQVVAVDDQSTYPPEAPRTDLSGFEPNVEAIAAFEPDLVVVSFDPADLEASLEALEIPVLLQPAAATFEDTYEQIEQLGALTGNADRAAELAASMRSEIDRLAASVPAFDQPPTYFHELDPSLFTATSDTFLGQVYGLAGLRNIADRAKGAASGYPQLSAEYLIDADPDLIFLADTKCCGQTADTIAERPGWDRLSAVRTGAVIELDDDVASRWGPRVVDFVREVVRAVTELRAAVAA